MSQRRDILHLACRSALGELQAAQEAYQASRTRKADRVLQKAWKSHCEATVRLNRAAR